MRTPNTQCIVCSKPLYRRPNELEKYPNSCCKGCRSAYYKTKEASPNLSLGRKKGTNNLTGVPKSYAHREKMKKIMSDWCAKNPDKVKARGEKTRREKHYNWGNDASLLNHSIRTMGENRKWTKAVKNRDKACLCCGSKDELEVDHIKPFAVIIKEHQINSKQDARNCAELWDTQNGRTLCRKCHCEKDGKKYTERGKGKRQK